MSLSLRNLPLYLTVEADVDTPGAFATASGLANAGALTVDIAGLLGTASAAANDGTITAGFELAGSLATATAGAFSGTTGIDDYRFRDRFRFFQLRPLPTADEEL